jgi:hypothetical protein
VVLTFAISPTAPASLTLVPTISAPADADVIAAPITVQVGKLDGLLAAETEHGAVVAIGNSVTTCRDQLLGCADAREGKFIVLDNNYYAMQYVNTAGGKFNSSSADLSYTGTVSRAFLTWSGDTSQNGTRAPDATAQNKVSFTTPAGTTTTVTADAIGVQPDASYFAYAEVTSLMSGLGTYSVADIQTAVGVASFGGWSLVIVTHDAALPERFLMVTAPFDVLESNPATTSAFTVDLPQAMTNATATLIAVGFETDRLLTTDTVSLSGFTIKNAFRSSAPGPRNPSYDNTFGTDVMIAAASGLNGSQLSFNATTHDDRILLALVAVALDV